VLRPSIAAPGELSEGEVRALWQLRLSLLPLKPEVEPERDFANFSRFVSHAHVGRLLDARGRPHAMFCYQTEEGSFADVRYHMAAFEYGFVSVPARGHPGIVIIYAALLLGCRSYRPGVRNYFVGCGYPRSFVLLDRVLHDLRFDGEPELDALERHLVSRFIARHVGDKYDAARQRAVLPTLPQPLDASYRARYRDNPILRRYEQRLPDWEWGLALIGISRLDGGYAKLAREALRRVQHGLRRWLAERDARAGAQRDRGAL
jgi:hypothetical protein